MPAKGSLIQRIVIQTLGGLYNDLIGRRTHLGVGAAIFDYQGRVLLVRQSYGQRSWELPGGGRKPRESVQAAVRREVREEVGVDLAAAELRAVYYEAEVDQHHFLFACRLNQEVVPRVNSVEILECQFWPLDGLPRPMTEFTARRISDAAAKAAVTRVQLVRATRLLD